MRPFLFAAFLLLPSVASAQMPLSWKFREGDAFTYERVIKSEQATVVKDEHRKQDVRSTWVYRCQVGKTTAESATIEAMFEQVAVQHVAGTIGVENKILEKTKGATLTLTVTPRGEIIGMAGYDKLIDQVTDKRDGQDKLIRQLLSEDVVRQELQDVFAILPKEPIAAGARWQREGPPLATPPLGRFLMTLNATHGGLDLAGHHKLVGSLLGKYERPEQPFQLFRISGGNLSLEKGQWACVFDNDAGRVMSQRATLEIRGDLTVELQGAATPVAVSIRREAATRLLPRSK